MNFLIVLAGQIDFSIKNYLKNNSIDFIIGVDGGNDHLLNEKIIPDIAIGDFDSIIDKEKIQAEKIIELNPIKDNTDFEMALQYIENNFEGINKIIVVGYFDSCRFEHLYVNLKHLRKNMLFYSAKTKIYLLDPGTYKFFNSKNNYYSFFTTSEVENLNLKNFKYELEKYRLKKQDNLCISNELIGKEGVLSFSKGELIVFESE